MSSAMEALRASLTQQRKELTERLAKIDAVLTAIENLGVQAAADTPKVKKAHWTQRPENRKRVLAMLRKATKVKLAGHRR